MMAKSRGKLPCGIHTRFPDVFNDSITKSEDPPVKVETDNSPSCLNNQDSSDSSDTESQSSTSTSTLESDSVNNNSEDSGSKFSDSVDRDAEDSDADYIDPEYDSEDESIEDTITSAGALRITTGGSHPLATISNSDSDSESPTSNSNAASETASTVSQFPYGAKHTLNWHNNTLEHSSEPFARCNTPSEVEEQVAQQGQSIAYQDGNLGKPGYPPVPKLPSYFPRNIKKIYRTDHKGGGLKFKELNKLTHFRTILSLHLRKKWREYIPLSKQRFNLQRSIQKLRRLKFTKTFYQYLMRKFQKSKIDAFNAFRKLERVQWGMEIVDATLNLNFRQERVTYKKRLGARKWKADERLVMMG